MYEGPGYEVTTVAGEYVLMLGIEYSPIDCLLSQPIGWRQGNA